MIIAMIERVTRVCGLSQGFRGLPIRDEIVEDRVTKRRVNRMTTAWTPTPDELERLNAGANVHVCILGTVPAPMLVEVGPVPEST